MRSILLINYLLICFVFSGVESKVEIKEKVKTENGWILGEACLKSKVVSFKGIPFAAPPIGNLRWKAPQSVSNWDGVLECKKYSASAIQTTPASFYMWTSEFIAPAEPLSEDCLYLNVWTAAKKETEKLPVIVFIHGGGFSSGSGSVPIYDGEEMAKKGVVFVTINYRVGVLGFLAHPELTQEGNYGNFGLLDQVAALKWVQKNIAAFGGNPDNVTIAGQSAGAFSVNYLVASPFAKGLFHRAIAESGGAVLPTNGFSRGTGLKEAEKTGLELMKKLKVSSIKEMRKVPAEELLKANIRTGPVIDGHMLPTNMYSLFAKGHQNDVPVLLGWNANEGFGGPPVSAEKYIENAKKQYGEKAAEFLKCFPAENNDEAKKSQAELGSLMIFGLQAFKWMEFHNKTEKSKVYMYYFTRKVPYGKGQKDFGAFHTGEVPYAYNNLKMSKVRPWDKIDYQLADVMSSYWVNFAKNGDPNGKNLPKWLPCKVEAYHTMYLGETQKLWKINNAKGLKFLTEFFESKIKN